MLEEDSREDGGRGPEQVQGGRQRKRSIQRQRYASGMETSRKKQEISNTWSEDCWARIFSWFREHNLQRIQSMKLRA